MIKLTTLYAGNVAPGGLYDPISKKYIKACGKANAGFHPHKYALGGFDDPVIQKLIELGCQQIQLEIATGVYTIPFQTFLEHGFSQLWRDTRYHFPRWYCPLDKWQSDHQVIINRPAEEAPLRERQEQRQASLFGAEELREVAGQSRGWQI